jgi:hypothetical protein
MIASSRLSGRFSFPGWDSIWRGTGSTRTGLFKMIWALARLVVVNWLWATVVQIARIQPPIKTLGAVLALISIALFAWSLWGLWQGLRALGLKRLLLVLVLVFALVVAFNVLTVADTRPVGERILTQMGVVLSGIGNFVGNAVQSVIRAPDEFLFAYTGQRASRPLPPGVPTLDPRATPVRVIVRPGSGGPPPELTLRVGDHAEVVNTEGQPLRARSGPGLSFDIVTRFPEGARVVVLDGPVDKDGYTWWKVRGEQGEGWCADRWLVPTE